MAISTRSLLHSPALALLLSVAACEHDPLPGGDTGSFRATDFLGEWVGTWSNLADNRSGPATFAVTQPSSDTLSLTVDLDGDVFGAGDPPAQEFVLAITQSQATLSPQTSTTYGSLSGRWNANGAISAQATNVVVGSVRSFTLTGEWRDVDVELDATLTYSGNTTARATVRLARR